MTSELEDDDDNLEGFEDALDGGTYESWVFADDLVDNAAEWSDDEPGRGGGGSSSSSNSINGSSKDQRPAGGGGVDYASQYVSVFPLKSGSKQTGDASEGFSSTDDDEEEEEDGFDGREGGFEGRSSSSSSSSSTSLRYFDEQSGSRGIGTTGSRSWNEDRDRELQDSHSADRSRGTGPRGRLFGNGEGVRDGRQPDGRSSSVAVGGSGSSGAGPQSLVVGKGDGRTSPSEALLHSSFQLGNFETVQIQVHPSRIAVHPSTGKLYHIADFVLLFPNVPHRPYTGTSGNNSELQGSAAANIERGRSTTGTSASVPMNKQPKARPQDSHTPRADRVRNSREKSSSDGKDDVKSIATKPKVSRAATAEMSEMESAAGDASADAPPALPHPDDHPDAVRIHTVKRSTKDVHGLRLCQELNTRSGLIWLVECLQLLPLLVHSHPHC